MKVFARPYSENTYWDKPQEREAQPGMDLRDYFAAAALTGMLAAGQALDDGIETVRVIIEGSYMLADAMMKERSIGEKHEE